MSEQNKAHDPDFIFDVLREIAYRIEKCGASIELTNAVSLVTDLSLAIGNKSNPANKYALERVLDELSK